jgi:transcription elongation factor Elf1
MDPQQKADYLQDPYHCPYCNSDRIFALEFKTDSFTQQVECAACGKQWTETYTLTDIEPASHEQED